MLALWLIACAIDEQSSYVAPFDGQTSWPLDAPIEVALPADALPPDYPVDAELLRVVDLTVGGIVEGDLIHDGRWLRFHPDGNWPAGHEFAWSLLPPIDAARQPQLAIPDRLLGEARFTTTGAMEVADAVIDRERLCVLLSRPYADEPVYLSVDGLVVSPPYDLVEVVVAEVDQAQPSALQALCVSTDPLAESVRVELPSGVYELPPRTATSLGGFQSLHRIDR
jgi:hypothetical protein